MSSVSQPPPRHDDARVLLAYAGVHGSTRSTAERIAARLEERGVHADVVPVDAVDDPGAYDAFVVGSAVHDMAWLPQALTFVHANRDLLVRRGVWLFSVGMPAALRGPWKALVAKEEDHVVGGLAAELHPLGHRLFSGVIEPGHLTRAGRVEFRAMGLRYGDYRDWSAVDAWAEEVGRDLLGRGAEGDGAPA
ncbi:flavodoxin domain-containing protein [Streptomyces sp. MS191]|uniref:flavodoxin domain-containing protein n=1 Tax=Streptomyces sp. ms191 TaxID=1827978 RepID=UPI0021CA9F9C|nr:flavodoxin domain-containing protein [Streptomyces sp. ms191]